MHKLNNQTGAIHFVLVGVAVLVLLAGAGAWVYMHQEDNKSITTKKQKTVPQQKDDVPQYTELSTSQIQDLDNTRSKKEPAQQEASSSSSQSSSQQNTTPAQPAPTTVEGKITFSADGCSVTGTGEPGWIFEVGSYNATLTKGGSVKYTLPASGTLTQSAGGFKNMYAFGKLSNAQGVHIRMEQVPIEAEQCPPAS